MSNYYPENEEYYSFEWQKKKKPFVFVVSLVEGVGHLPT
jgi:hypothetical protein